MEYGNSSLSFFSDEGKAILKMPIGVWSVLIDLQYTTRIGYKLA